ncbi:MAG: PleD family two-component system response regulator [Nitrospinota bacterium]
MKKKNKEVTYSLDEGREPAVLCIDDDPDVLDLLEQYLRDAGYHMVGLTNPNDAVQKAKEFRPMAITLDIRMPNKDGWSILKELKEDPLTHEIPVILLTILDEKDLGYELGAFDYLQKPINPNLLLTVIERTGVKKVETILIVDDEPESIDLMKGILEEQGIDVDSAGNGKEALETIGRKIPDLMVLDLMMPEMDGFEVISRMRAKKEWAGIPVLVVTGKSLSQEEREFLNLKVEVLMNKAGMSRESVLREVTRTLSSIEKNYV